MAGVFPDAVSALNLAAARLPHVAGTAWSTHRYLNIGLLKDQQMRGAITAQAIDGGRSAQIKCAKDSGHFRWDCLSPPTTQISRQRRRGAKAPGPILKSKSFHKHRCCKNELRSMRRLAQELWRGYAIGGPPLP